ncbi:MAG TPA: hypothetical protein PKY81_06655 [bacterium]|nr:hypothetical protein [bacterium]
MKLKTKISKLFFFAVFFIISFVAVSHSDEPGAIKNNEKLEAIRNAESVKILCEYALYPDKILELADIDKFSKIPEFNLVSQMFKNSETAENDAAVENNAAAENDPSVESGITAENGSAVKNGSKDLSSNSAGYFGINFDCPVILNMISTGSNKMPDILLKLKIQEFDKFNLSIQFLSSQKFYIEEFDSKRNLYFLYKTGSDSMQNCFPVLYKDNFLYVLIDALSANSEFARFKGAPIDYYASNYRIDRALNIITETERLSDNFLKDEIKANCGDICLSGNVLFYLINKFPVSFLADLYGGKKTDAGGFIKNLFIAEISDSAIRYLKYDFPPEEKENAAPQNNFAKEFINNPAYNLLNDKMKVLISADIRKNSIVEFRNNSDIQIPGLNYFINNFTDLLNGTFIFYCVKSDSFFFKTEKNGASVSNNQTGIFKSIAGFFTPVLFFNISNQNEFIELLYEMAAVFPDNFQIFPITARSGEYKIEIATKIGIIQLFMMFKNINGVCFTVLSTLQEELGNISLKYDLNIKTNYFLNHLIDRKINFNEINDFYFYADLQSIFASFQDADNNSGSKLNPVQKNLLNYLIQRLDSISGYQTAKTNFKILNASINLFDKISLADIYMIIKKSVLKNGI